MQAWGRLLIAGGTDFANLGRKEKLPSEHHPDLPSAHLVRTVANIKFTRCITSHSGCHAVFLDSQSFTAASRRCSR